MSNITFFFVVVGVATATSWVFKLVDLVEGGEAR